MTLLQLDDLTVGYPGRKPVLDRLSFSLSKGDRLGLIGPNGSGKTTLLYCIMGLLRPESGTITVFERQMRKEADFAPVRRRIGFLFQSTDDQLFHPTVIEDVAFGPLNLGKTPSQAHDIALKTLEELGLEAFSNRLTHKLSGGEKRLVALATVLAMEPEVLLLDEPTTGLDKPTKARLVDILNQKRLPCLIASHEYDFLTETTDRLVALHDGKILTNGKMLHSHMHTHELGTVPHKHE